MFFCSVIFPQILLSSNLVLDWYPAASHLCDGHPLRRSYRTSFDLTPAPWWYGQLNKKTPNIAEVYLGKTQYVAQVDFNKRTVHKGRPAISVRSV